MVHVPVLSSAAKMPFPGATIFWAVSTNSFLCSGVRPVAVILIGLNESSLQG